MKQLILVLFVLVFAFCSCSKTDDNLSNDPGSTKQDTDDDELPVPIPINEVDDSLNPFKILGEVKSAKLVSTNWITYGEFSYELENPAKWPKLLFSEYEDVNWTCKHVCKIVFNTSTGTYNVHLKPIQCELGEYEKGKTRLFYNFSPEFYTEFVEVIKSKTKPDEPHHQDNLNAAFLITQFKENNSKDSIEAIQLMKNFIKDNEDIDEEIKESVQDYIRWHNKD